MDHEEGVPEEAGSHAQERDRSQETQRVQGEFGTPEGALPQGEGGDSEVDCRDRKKPRCPCQRCRARGSFVSFITRIGRKRHYAHKVGLLKDETVVLKCFGRLSPGEDFEIFCLVF